MPLGAFRINTLAKTQAVAAGPSGLEAIEINLVKAPGSNNISTQPASATGEFTLAFWFKYGAGSTGENTIVLNLNEGTSGGVGNALIFCEMYQGRFRIGVRDSTNNFRCDMLWADSNSTGTAESTFGNGHWDGNWHHYALAVNSSDPGITFYADGVARTNWAELAGRITAGNKSEFNVYDSFNLLSQWNDAQGGNNTFITQLWMDDTEIDLSTNISKFYSSGAVDMGTDGTASGLSQPLIFHTGGYSDFFTKGGDTSSFNYTVTKDTTNGDAIDVSADDGPQF